MRPKGPKKMAAPVIVLAPARSFTSVVTAMIGRHPQLYGLPETHPFVADTLADRWREGQQAKFPMNHGLIRAIAEIRFGGQTEATVRQARAWLRRRRRDGLTMGALLKGLAKRVHPRALVDKSPSTVLKLESMRRAHALFSHARFIHLLRHPRTHGESVMKLFAEQAKLGPIPPAHWLIEMTSPPSLPAGEEPGLALPAGGPDPQWGWCTTHRNILHFLSEVPAAQVYRVRGEDVLTDPDNVLSQLAGWLGLRTDPAAIDEMKHPERSPFACYGPPGAGRGNDPYFLEDSALRPERAAPSSLEGPLSWRSDGAGFAPAVRRLAQELGYR